MLNCIRSVINKIKGIDTTLANELRALEKEYAALLRKSTVDTSRVEGNENAVTKLSMSGINKYGVEVYETSKEIMDLTWNERKNKYLDVMKNEYRGRTARFRHNGHTYYAKFDTKSVNKHIYGDDRSSPKGIKALIKVGADGDVFDLVENSQYDGSSINKKNHTKADYFDYFVKTVQIDGKVFDLIADVEKKYGDNSGYVYTLALRDNKKIKASPAIKTSKEILTENAGNNLIKNILTKKGGSVNKKSSYSKVDTEGNTLSEAQQEYFKDSAVRDTEGRLIPVYHGTEKGGFTVFILFLICLHIVINFSKITVPSTVSSLFCPKHILSGCHCTPKTGKNLCSYASTYLSSQNAVAYNPLPKTLTA